MSELKACKMVDEKYCTDCVCVIPSDVYLKSEADKVIAHHKHKRCLAMAEWCDAKADWYYSLGESFVDCVQFYIKWNERWLKIAEKFKEAK